MRHLRSWFATVLVVTGCGEGAPSTMGDDGFSDLPSLSNLMATNIPYQSPVSHYAEADNGTTGNEDPIDVIDSNLFLSFIKKRSAQHGDYMIPMKGLQPQQLRDLLRYYNQESRSENKKAEIKEKASASLRKHGYNVLFVQPGELNRREIAALLDLLGANVFASTHFLSLFFLWELSDDEVKAILCSFNKLVGIEVYTAGFTDVHRQILSAIEFRYLSMVGNITPEIAKSLNFFYRQEAYSKFSLHPFDNDRCSFSQIIWSNPRRPMYAP